MAKESKSQKTVADALAKMLADTYGLYLKTQNFHWNVKGSDFYILHQVFEGHYNDLANAVDEIAERLRILGHYAPGSFKTYLELMDIKENDKEISAKDMVAELLDDHEKIAKLARNHIRVAQEEDDEGTVNLLGERIGVHEKTAWMLRSYLNK